MKAICGIGGSCTIDVCCDSDDPLNPADCNVPAGQTALAQCGTGRQVSGKAVMLGVFDARDGMNMTPEARRYSNEASSAHPVSAATLLVGASLAIRTMTSLLINAARLFGKKLAPVEYCDTVDEVPRWLAAQRRIQQQRGRAVARGGGGG